MRTGAIIVLLPGADPDVDRLTIGSDDQQTTVVAVAEPAAAGAIANGLMGGGAAAVELCGGLGPSAAARVVSAVGGRAPVGAVAFGIDSAEGAVAFRDRVDAGLPTSAGFVLLHPGLDPNRDAQVLIVGALRTAFVPVPTEAAAVDAARQAVDGGAHLIELYNGIGPVAVGQVIDAVGGRAPVGAVSYGRT